MSDPKPSTLAGKYMRWHNDQLRATIVAQRKVEELRAALAASQAEVERITKERDEAKTLAWANEKVRHEDEDAHAMALEGCRNVWRAAVEQITAERDALKAEAERLKGLLDRDKTGLAKALNAVRHLLLGYGWIPDGEWGCYSHEERTEGTLRAEIGRMMNNARAVIEAALVSSGQLADAAFRPTADAILSGSHVQSEADRMRDVLRRLTAAISAYEAWALSGKSGEGRNLWGDVSVLTAEADVLVGGGR